MWPSIGGDSYHSMSYAQLLQAAPGFQFVKTCKCVYHCMKCGKRIETYWLNLELEGEFMAEESEYSEVFETWLPVANKVKCKECYVG